MSDTRIQFALPLCRDPQDRPPAAPRRQEPQHEHREGRSADHHFEAAGETDEGIHGAYIQRPSSISEGDASTNDAADQQERDKDVKEIQSQGQGHASSGSAEALGHIKRHGELAS
jgi:hypothetical protein